MGIEVIGKRLESVYGYEYFLIYKFSESLYAIECFRYGEKPKRSTLSKKQFRKTYYTCRSSGKRLENKEGYAGDRGFCSRLRFSADVIENLFIAQ